MYKEGEGGGDFQGFTTYKRGYSLSQNTKKYV